MGRGGASMGRGGASTPLITAVARSTLGQNRTRMYTGASHTNNNLSPDFPVSDHDHPDNRVQHQRDSSSEPTEVIVSDPQSQLVESWMKFRNGNWSAMSPWHGPPLGTIKFRCHPHPPPSPTTAMHLLIHPGTSASQAKCISLRFSGRNFTTRN